jgi:hypothetical protein
MLRIVLSLVVLCGLSNVGVAQQTSANTSTTSCTFQDGMQLSVRYNNQATKNKRLPEGKIWSPGDKPMFLFTQVGLTVANSQIPAGAYSMYLIPKRGDWTLVLNKDVTDDSKYDEHKDLLRVPMEVGQLSEPQQFSLFFGHVAPKQCNIRVYSGKIGTWAEFKEK